VVPSNALQSLQHLRRIIKPNFLPPHLRVQFTSTDVKSSSDSCSPIATVYLLIGPTSAINYADLVGLFEKNDILLSGHKAQILSAHVPALAPTSASQAIIWTEELWPTVFRNTNPYGPHPAIIRRAEVELLMDGGPERWMALAQQAARESTTTGVGVGVGTVVLERGPKGNEAKVIAIAGDARFHIGPVSNGDSACSNGNVMGHAVMRAIGMVAKKRVLLAKNQLNEWTTVKSESGQSPFLNSPLTPTEEQYFKANTLESNGYLCLDLEIYVTHEPCIMCSMAILHSRFGRIVFGQRMIRTGALTAEASNENGSHTLGYGLFWRPVELNWRLLCWEFTGENKDQDSVDLESIHA